MIARTTLWLLILAGLAGCGRSPGTHEVPLSRGQGARSLVDGPDRVAQPPRAIATH